MSRVELAPEVGADLDHIFNHLAQFDAADVPLRTREIIHAIAALEQNPLIGRPADDNKRELVIGRDARGYVALYRYIVEIDTVFVLALRAHREAGYTGT
ncbi:type II toxin-antitoxin system RelE/ParE family toxin [Immundisolibacter sp.]